MPAWRDLPQRDLQGLVTYLQDLTPVSPTSTIPASLRGAELDEVKALYARNCVTCHGPNGAGDGPAAAALARAPTNFLLKRPTTDHARRVLIEGVPGTAMPPWEKQLTSIQREALVAYVQSLFNPVAVPSRSN